MGNDEIVRLKTLLNYWMEHNEEHSREFKEWADKVKGFGEVEAGEEILQAAQKLNEASELLARALRRLEKKER